MVELDALNIHLLWTPSPYFMHSKVTNIINKEYDLSLAAQGQFRSSIISATESLHVYPDKSVSYFTIMTQTIFCK